VIARRNLQQIFQSAVVSILVDHFSVAFESKDMAGWKTCPTSNHGYKIQPFHHLPSDVAPHQIEIDLLTGSSDRR
jgi:hypothetical protein